MNKLFRGLVWFFLVLSLVSCKKTLKPQDFPDHIVIGSSYYTQFVIRYEKNAHLTTNYRRGAYIPVNSHIRLLGISSKIIEVEVDSLSRSLLIKNVPKHTGDDIFQAFDKLFGVNKASLRRFNSVEKKNINSGSVAKGMSKSAVKVAIGYPPVTETMNLDANSWIYWNSRFDKFRVEFKNGKVSQVID